MQLHIDTKMFQESPWRYRTAGYKRYCFQLPDNELLARDTICYRSNAKELYELDSHLHTRRSALVSWSAVLFLSVGSSARRVGQ